jgi:ubiquinone/menaquinone biosynthesis C-methylase UbiE
MATSTHPTERPDLESSSDDYASRFAGSVGRYFLEVQQKLVHEMLPTADDCRILDVGGGHAQLAPWLVDAGFDVTVFGSDDSCCDRLDREVGQGQYSFAAGSLLDLPFEQNSFDVVLGFRLLPHLENWMQFLHELCRVARDRVIVDYPTVQSMNWFSTQLFAWKQKVESNARPFNCFRNADVENTFDSLGFKVVRSVGQFVLPMALHRLVGMAAFSRTTEWLARLAGLTALFGSPIIVQANCS